VIAQLSAARSCDTARTASKGIGVENLVTALVARRYYLEGQTKSQITDAGAATALLARG
jgi:hypothetical protein